MSFESLNLDELKDLHRKLEMIFIPILIVGLLVMFFEIWIDTFVFSLFIAGALMVASVLLSFTWISSMNKAEVIKLMKLKGDMFSIIKERRSVFTTLKRFTQTSYRIVLYPTVTLFVLQLTLSELVKVTYSVTDIILMAIALTTTFHFLPLQIKIHRLRQEAHTRIRRANASNLDSHILLQESTSGRKVGKESMSWLVNSVTTNTDTISCENNFLDQTISSPALTIVRYLLPVLSSVALHFPIRVWEGLILALLEVL